MVSRGEIGNAYAIAIAVQNDRLRVKLDNVFAREIVIGSNLAGNLDAAQGRTLLFCAERARGVVTFFSHIIKAVAGKILPLDYDKRIPRNRNKIRVIKLNELFFLGLGEIADDKRPY